MRPTNLIKADLGDIARAIIVPFSDMHYGSPQFNEELFNENLAWARKRDDVWLILNADLIECATRTSIGAGIYEQSETLQQQLEWAIDTFMPFAEEGRILGSTNGNHEDRIYKSTGLDVSAIMAGAWGVPYYKNGGFFKIKVSKQNYVFYGTHGSSGAKLPYTKIKSVLNLSSFMEGVDVYFMGHVHDLQTHTQEVQRVNSRNNTVERLERHFVLTGHYLNWENSYAQQASMMPSKQGTPKIKLSGLEHRVRVSI